MESVWKLEHAFERAKADGKAEDDTRIRIFFVLALFAAGFFTLALGATKCAIFSDADRSQIAAAPPDQGGLAGDKMATPPGSRAERIRIAGIGAPESQLRQARRRAEISLGKAAIAHARTLLDGRNVTIMRVGRGR